MIPLVQQLNRGELTGALRNPPMPGGAPFFPVGKQPAASWASLGKHLKSQPRTSPRVTLRGIDFEESDFGRAENGLLAAGHHLFGKSWEDVAYLSRELTDGMRDLGTTQNSRIEARSSGASDFMTHSPAPFRQGDGDPNWELWDECLSNFSAEKYDTKINSLFPGFALNDTGWRELYRTMAECGVLQLHVARANRRVLGFAVGVLFENLGQIFFDMWQPEVTEETHAAFRDYLKRWYGQQKAERVELYGLECQGARMNTVRRCRYQFSNQFTSRVLWQNVSSLLRRN